MKLFVRPVDLTSVRTIVYHLPDGPSLSLEIDGIEEFEGDGILHPDSRRWQRHI